MFGLKCGDASMSTWCNKFIRNNLHERLADEAQTMHSLPDDIIVLICRHVYIFSSVFLEPVRAGFAP